MTTRRKRKAGGSPRVSKGATPQSDLGTEIWTVASTRASGMGDIASGLTHEDAWHSALTRQERGDRGVVVMTDNAASNLLIHRCGQPPRDNRISIVRNAEQ